jgi:hypothetical protein
LCREAIKTPLSLAVGLLLTRRIRVRQRRHVQTSPTFAFFGQCTIRPHPQWFF